MFREMDENKTYLYSKEARRPTMVQKIYTWLLYAYVSGFLKWAMGGKQKEYAIILSGHILNSLKLS
jgi:hypothetical protein